eukprot:scaffold105179_cov45-Phaeocystis_antarctica.AAC.3
MESSHSTSCSRPPAPLSNVRPVASILSAAPVADWQRLAAAPGSHDLALKGARWPKPSRLSQLIFDLGPRRRRRRAV